MSNRSAPKITSFIVPPRFTVGLPPNLWLVTVLLISQHLCDMVALVCEPTGILLQSHFEQSFGF